MPKNLGKLYVMPNSNRTDSELWDIFYQIISLLVAFASTLTFVIGDMSAAWPSTMARSVGNDLPLLQNWPKFGMSSVCGF